MASNDLLIPAGVGLLVWVGTYFPMRQVVGAVIDGHARLLAIGLSAMLGTAALTAWNQPPWYRYSVLAITITLVAVYLSTVLLGPYRNPA